MMQISSFLLLAVTGASVQLMVPQDDVLPMYGCGAGCRIEVEQLSPVEDFGNGWRKVKVEKTTWIQVWNEETQRPEDGPPNWRGAEHKRISWLYANCSTEVFATADNPHMVNASYMDVYYREGENYGEPKYQTVHGNPFMQWAKLCPVEAERGTKKILDLRRELNEALKNMQKQ